MKSEDKMWYRNEDVPMIALIGQVSYMLEELAKRMFARFDMKPWQAGILLALSGKELSQKELAERMNVTPSTITTSIQKMEREGYVMRSPDERDQRVMRLSTTEKSDKYLENLGEVGKLMDEAVFTEMSVEERIVLKRLLLQVCENLCRAEEETREHERGAKERKYASRMQEYESRVREFKEKIQVHETKAQEIREKMQEQEEKAQEIRAKIEEFKW